MYHKLQYISQGETPEAHYSNIQRVLDAGGKWIQLRIKNSTTENIRPLAERVKRLCDQYQATFIINDYASLVNEVDASGVHLGLDDQNVFEARKLLGDYKIIGGTANTMTHVFQRVIEKCDYIGLGPFAFTSTKEKLSPILRVEGYQSILTELSNQGIKTPVYAIGGIQVQDVSSILKTGVYGIAVSGLLTSQELVSNLSQLTTILYAEA